MSGTIDERAIQIRQFNRFYTNIIGLVNQTVLESPYSLAEVRVLLEIDKAGQCRASDLTGLLQIDPGYLSRMLARLKREQIITTARSLQDGRAQLLSLTDKGRRLFRGLSDSSTRQIIAMLEAIPGREQEKLVSYMQAIQDILSHRDDNSITIRPWRPGDLGYIAHRHGVLYEQEYGLDQSFERYVLAGMVKFLENGARGNVWVAEFGGQIVGSIAIVDADTETAQLRWFLIEPEFRGAGLGRRLMDTAMDYCRQRAFRRVFLWTFQGLDAACHLYGRAGFAVTEQAENNTWAQRLIEERWDFTPGD
ncbi:MAG: helix-turn-helix domain-containing GNAT family N-acetyltransferase [Negativicutes bacterium]|nr:helix-turn-helix domain-containing GNAT family N-acetyltransferase [Negativicutes bacterium]